MTDQEKREKVIKGLKCCLADPNSYDACGDNNCPYYGEDDCSGMLREEAIAMIEEQDAR